MLADLEVRAQQLERGQQRHRPGVRHPSGVEDGRALRHPALGELAAQAALAHTGLADDPHDLPVPGPRLLQRLLERPQLALAPDEAREPARVRDVEPSSRRADTRELVDADRPARALDLDLAQVGQLDIALRQRRGVLGDVHRARPRKLLHALGEAHGVADGRVGHGEVLADRAHHDLAGVQAHAHGEADTVRALHVRGEDRELFPEVHGGVAGAARVVLVGDRRPEERHDAVAGELVDRALEAVDAAAQDRHEVGHEPSPGLGADALGEVHRADRVGEEHGDLLALPLERGPAGADLRREMLRRGGERRVGRQRPAAVVAEARAVAIGLTASPAKHGAPRPPADAQTSRVYSPVRIA